MSLYKGGKYLQAFKIFEKLTLGVCAQNPKLWYYMGLCALEANKDIYDKNCQAQSELYEEKLGYGLPHYVK